MRSRHDTLPDDPTDPSIERATSSRGGFREETTAAAETRTVKLGNAAPWFEGPDAPLRETQKRDPLLVPVVVFVTLLIVAIAYMFSSQPPRRPGSSQAF
jgi:hypothetical protein